MHPFYAAIQPRAGTMTVCVSAEDSRAPGNRNTTLFGSRASPSSFLTKTSSSSITNTGLRGQDKGASLLRGPHQLNGMQLRSLSHFTPEDATRVLRHPTQRPHGSASTMIAHRPFSSPLAPGGPRLGRTRCRILLIASEARYARVSRTESLTPWSVVSTPSQPKIHELAA